jgi:large subunit ribosomal protein L24
MKIKVKDKVLVLAGKYKGKVGTVTRTYKKTNRVTVEKINIRTKHVKKTTTRAGQIIKYEAPFDASNAMIICPNCNKAVRISYNIPAKSPSGQRSKQRDASRKYRVCKKCGESVEQAVSKVEKKKK